MIPGPDNARLPVFAHRAVAAVALLAWVATPSARADETATDAQAARPYRIVADGIPEPLSATTGDAARGRALMVARAAAKQLTMKPQTTEEAAEAPLEGWIHLPEIGSLAELP